MTGTETLLRGSVLALAILPAAYVIFKIIQEIMKRDLLPLSIIGTISPFLIIFWFLPYIFDRYGRISSDAYVIFERSGESRFFEWFIMAPVCAISLMLFPFIGKYISVRIAGTIMSFFGLVFIYIR